MTTYNNVLTNISGKDRQQMLKVWEDDEAFDLWLEAFSNKMSNDSGGGSQGSGHVRISSDEYLSRYAKVYGGEEE